jgi:FkbM family methyltransferase
LINFKNTIYEDWKCEKLHRIESRQNSFDFIFFCEDLSPELDCIMYSFGINYQFGNEEHLRDRYNCTVYTFDPSMTKIERGYIQNVRPRIDFYRVGLSNNDVNIPKPITKETLSLALSNLQNNGWTMARYSTLVKMLNHTNKVIDLVAIDAEGAEYGFLEDIVETGVWKNIKQLNIEFHLGADKFHIRHARALNQFRRLGQFLQIKHELFTRNTWNIDAGEELNGKHASLIIVQYINKMYLRQTELN